jgi:hypothetical protein
MPAPHDWRVKKRFDPEIELDELSIPDISPEEQDQSGSHEEKRLGSVYPLMKILSQQFNQNHILRFRLSSSGYKDFLPTISTRIKDPNLDFLDANYPLDGETLSVFLRTYTDQLKPLRNDYLITSVNSSTSRKEGRGNEYTINGYLKVPRLFGEVCKSFKEKTSYEVLQEIAKDLNLGFASNVDSTDDKMNWICPFDSYFRFIKTVCSHAYKDEKSFFVCFIDIYYYLNFVDVNKLFNESDNLEPAQDGFYYNNDYYTGKDLEEKLSEENVLFLTNANREQMKDKYIKSYTLENESGDIVRNNGYKRYAKFYDQNQKSYEDQFVQPQNTEANDDKRILRGRLDEEHWRDENKHKWLGIQTNTDGGSVHPNYLYSKIQNFQNYQEIYKMQLNVTLGSWNPNILRFQRMPLFLYFISNFHQVQKNTPPEEQQETKETKTKLDEFLSGKYVVTDFDIHYDIGNSQIIQKVTMVKREWDTNYSLRSNQEFQQRLDESSNKGVSES